MSAYRPDDDEPRTSWRDIAAGFVIAFLFLFALWVLRSVTP